MPYPYPKLNAIGSWKTLVSRSCRITAIITVTAAGGMIAIAAEMPEQISYLVFDAPANENGGFEHLDTTGTPVGWKVAGVGDFRWRHGNALTRRGGGAMYAVLEGPADEAKEARLTSAPFPAQPGDAVKYNAWFRCEGAPEAMPEIRIEAFMGDEWTALRPAPGGTTLPSSDWFPLGQTVMMPLNAQQARLVISLRNRTSSKVTWHVDDAFCEVISFHQYVAEHATAPRLKDILLLGTDTLRQSPLGCYGAANSHTPNMDLIAREGIVFRHVLATSMWTRPSFASIFTSLYPSQHTAELHNSMLPESVVTLTELLKEKGYFTVGFAMTRFDGFLGPGAGFAQGFDVLFHVENPETVNRLVMEYLDANGPALSAIKGGGLFLFWHIWDPHAPYHNHYPDMIVNRGLLRTDPAIDVTRVLPGSVLWEKIYPQRPGIANALDIEYARQLYYSEAWYIDRLIGDVFTRLRFHGLYDNLNIVLCSDHGESFNEPKGIWNHGNPYNTCAEVPLIMRLPGLSIPGSRNETDLVTNLDIMPTLLTVADIDIPPWLEGRCLVSTDLSGETRWGIAEDRKCGSLIIRDRRYKLIAIPASLPVSETADPYHLWRAMQPGIANRALTDAQLATDRHWVLAAPDSPTRFELYDLETDPGENNNIAAEHPEKLRALLIPLLAHCVRTGITTSDELRQARKLELSEDEMKLLDRAARLGQPRDSHLPEFLEMDPNTIEELKALGYF